MIGSGYSTGYSCANSSIILLSAALKPDVTSQILCLVINLIKIDIILIPILLNWLDLNSLEFLSINLDPTTIFASLFLMVLIYL